MSGYPVLVDVLHERIYRRRMEGGTHTCQIVKGGGGRVVQVCLSNAPGECGGVDIQENALKIFVAVKRVVDANVKV
ncbi:hypothetical protein, partial [Burkholderia sp. BCC1970]|uniref:hypothetical protein n=1 Tax=Burkholderia sp. BCC1970 TaxID=2817437 RepID=UPI0039F639FA